MSSFDVPTSGADVGNPRVPHGEPGADPDDGSSREYAAGACGISRPTDGAARPALLLLHGLGGSSARLLDYFPHPRTPLLRPISGRTAPTEVRPDPLRRPSIDWLETNRA